MPLRKGMQAWLFREWNIPKSPLFTWSDCVTARGNL